MRQTTERFKYSEQFHHHGVNGERALPSSSFSGFKSTPMIFDAPQILAPSAT
jgi:hypothetical protein